MDLSLKSVDPEIAQVVELERQRQHGAGKRQEGTEGGTRHGGGKPTLRPPRGKVKPQGGP